MEFLGTTSIIILIFAVIILIAIAVIGNFGFPWKKKNNLRSISLSSVSEHHSTRVEPTFTKNPQSLEENSDTSIEKLEQPALDIDFEIPTLPIPDTKLLYAEEFCYIIRLYGESPVSESIFQQLIKKYQQYQFRIYRVLYFNEESQQWKYSTPSSSSRYWLIAFPLADRSGKLSQDRIKLLEEEGRRFTEKNKLHSLFPSINSVLARSELLDDFCAEVDIMAELSLSLTRPQKSNRIVEVLEINKMSAEEKKYVCRRNSEILFFAQWSNATDNNVHVITFFLDAPKVSQPIYAFNEMIVLMKRIAPILDAKITDRQGRNIDEERIDSINQQLNALITRMNNNNVPPGGSLAHLLFS